MKALLPVILLTLAFNSFGHGGDDGPSNLEDEFSQLSHIHLPVNYSTTSGLSFAYSFGHSEHEEHDGHEGHEDEDTHADETGLEVNIHPTFFAGFDKISRLVSLAESETNSTAIEAASESSPFVRLDNKKWDLGIGMEGEMHLPTPLFVAGVGIAFLKGKNYYTLRQLKYKTEQREPLMLPFTQQALQSWRMGDELTYATKGSIIFNAFVGIEPFIHMGPEYVLTGSYRFKARLTSPQTMSVTITTIKTKSIGLEGAGFPFSGGMSKGKGHSDTIVYEFDLRNERSFEAISYLFNGRADLTNQAMMNSAGTIRVKTSLLNTSASITGSFGIPALYINGLGSGLYQSSGTIEENEEDETHVNEVFTTTSSSERLTRGLLSRHKWENQSIISTIMTGEHSLLSTVYSWSFSKDRMKASQFYRKLGRLAEVFNSSKLSEVTLPAEQVGYLKVDLNINLSGSDLLYLLHGSKLAQLANEAHQKLEADFQTYGYRAFCRVRSYANCLGRYKNLIQNKYQELKLIRASVEASYKEKQMLKVTQNLTKFVKVLFSSKYLTQAFQKARPDLQVKLLLEGETIKKHVLAL